MSILVEHYLSNIKIPFQVISDYSVELLCGVQWGFAGFCGDLKPPPIPEKTGINRRKTKQFSV